jgi:alpha-beta hydrolase superfamily lysophospholipase
MKIITIIIILAGFLFILAFIMQEKLLFFPHKVSIHHQFVFENDFEEYFIKVDKKIALNGLLFKADSSKGLVFYLHGNAGALDSWGHIASLYLKNNYDFFIFDYRGFGKSQGRIKSEKQLFSDVQLVYNRLKQNYEEKGIVIIGYSIGSGIAAQLASTNEPKLLILKAPYYNMLDLARHYIRILPNFFLRYKFRTNEFIKEVKCPIIIFHGNKDEVIYYESSLKLKENFKKGDRLNTLDGQAHNGINDNRIYQKELKKILN